MPARSHAINTCLGTLINRRGVSSRCVFNAPSHSCIGLALRTSRRRKQELRRQPSAKLSQLCTSPQALQIVFVATEVSPWSKIGGLGDVMASLPCQLASRGHAVMTVTPRYQAYADAQNTGIRVPLQLPQHIASKDSAAARAHQHCHPQQTQGQFPDQPWALLYHCQQGNVDRVFVDHPLFVDPCNQHRPGTYLYGTELPDLDLQYSILCQAALAAPILLWHQSDEHLHRQQLRARHQQSPQTLSGGIAQYIPLNSPVADLPAHRQIYGPNSTQPSIQILPTHTSAGQAQDKDVDQSHSISDRSKVPSKQLSSVSAWQGQHTADSQADADDTLWPATAGKIAFIGSDWPCFPLTQQLQHLQSLSTTKCPTGVQDAASGSVQACTDPVCAKAYGFEVHMARLLKSARVALCIHNLAYQGIYAEDCHKPICTLCTAAGHCSAHCCNASVNTLRASRCVVHKGSTSRLCLPQVVSKLKSASASQQYVSHASQSHTVDSANPPFPLNIDSSAQSSLGGAEQGAHEQQAKQSSVNWLRDAMVSSHMLLTVSPSHAADILQEPSASFGLYDVLKSKGIRGIMNGIDTGIWNPMTDKHLPVGSRYSSSTVSSGKKAAKAMFQEQFSLDVCAEVPLIGVIGRLTPQKGFDVVLAALPELLAPARSFAGRAPNGSLVLQAHAAQGRHSESASGSDSRPAELEHASCQLVLLGSGDLWTEGALSQIRDHFPGRACGIAWFSEQAAHRLVAAADYLLVPSRFEPCGLVAMHALRYGAVPIAAPVGGLKDTVSPQVGFTLECLGDHDKPADLRCNAKALAAAVKRAIAGYGSADYLMRQQAGMMQDVAWDLPAQKWEQALQEMLAA